MLRASPTSICLSPKDISAHLQYLDIYQGLLKQGFKKRDIQRYFRERRNATIAQYSTELDKPRHPTTDFLFPFCDKRETLSDSTSTSSVESRLGGDEGEEGILLSKTRQISQEAIARSDVHRLPATTGRDEQYRSGHERRVSSSSAFYANHAPRQSSLLRFASNASPDSEQGVDIQETVCIPLPMLLSNQAPKNADPSEDPELPDSSSTFSSLASVFQDFRIDESLVLDSGILPLKSTLRAEANEFFPMSEHPREPETGSLLADDNDLDTNFVANESDSNTTIQTGRIVPRLQTSSSIPQKISAAEMSSSPIPFTKPTDLLESEVRVSSPTLPSMPHTPMTGHKRSNTQAESVLTHHRFLDGPSFTPYNDAISADLQPQTQADIVRRPVIVAAYTAPPGVLRRDILPHLSERFSAVELGEESPTNRAITIRRRRNREFARSARIEGLRISRLQREYRQTRDEYPSDIAERDVVWIHEQYQTLWRDDLDADRVGEENFGDDDAPESAARPGMRRISGNRRADGI